MLVIVLYHSLCMYGIWKYPFASGVEYWGIEYWRGLCNLALNAFVFISGLLYARQYIAGKRMRVTQMLSNKSRRLLFPYIIWATIGILLFPTEDVFVSLITGVQHLWFLLMLLCIFVFASLMRFNTLNNKYLIGGGILFLILNAILAKFPSIPNYLSWLSAVKYMPAFISGMIAARSAMNNLCISRIALVVALSFSALLIIGVVTATTLPFGMFYSNLPTYIWLISLYLLLWPLVSHKECPAIIAHIDRHSMGIYILHHLLIWGVLAFVPSLVAFITEHFLIAPVLLFLAVLIISWAIATAINANHITAKLFGS